MIENVRSTSGSILASSEDTQNSASAATCRDPEPASIIAITPSHSPSADTTRRLAPASQRTVTVTQPARVRGLQWFHNLSVGRKQLLGSTLAIGSLLGLMGVGSLLLFAVGRHQLARQAVAELSVAHAAYNLKIDAVGRSFQSQATNPAIVNIASTAASGDSISDDAFDTVQQLLQTAAAAHELEYAILVGRDRTIVAHADRQGEPFTPDNLIAAALQTGKQIKTTALVPWQKLIREQGPLSADFVEQNALIQYTATPVTTSLHPDQVIGVLIAGDIINGTTTIPHAILTTFKNGYSAIYQCEADDSFALSTALYAGANPDVNAAQADVALTDATLVKQAMTNPEQTATRRAAIAGTAHTLAAQAITDFQGQPIAVLVRGTTELSQNTSIANSLKLHILLAGFAIAINVLLARFMGRSLRRPLLNLQQAAQKFIAGNHHVRADVFSTDEVGQVAAAFNQLANEITQSESRPQEQARQTQQTAMQTALLASLTQQIRQALDEQTILDAAVVGLRQVLAVDRVLVCRFRAAPDTGDIIAEAVAPHQPQLWGTTMRLHLTPESLEDYSQGRVTYQEDASTAATNSHEQAIADPLTQGAHVVAPLFAGEALVGLMWAQQAAASRQWRPVEIAWMEQIALQLSYALSNRKLRQQEQATTREQQLTQLIAQMRQNRDEASLHQATVTRVRSTLAADRVVIYGFDEEVSGICIAESVEANWPKLIASNIAASDAADRLGKGDAKDTFRQRMQVIANVAAAILPTSYRQQLDQHQVKAYLSTPIMVGDSLHGLLVAHQCAAPRDWENSDIQFLTQVATHLGQSLEQVRVLQQQQQAATLAQQLAAIAGQTQAASEETQIYRTVVDSVRQALTTDRVLLHWVNATSQGTSAAESINEAWMPVSGNDFENPIVIEPYPQWYQADAPGPVEAIADVQTADLPAAYKAQLRSLAVKASLVAPVMVEADVVGLLITHQCSHTRRWDPLEIDFIRQVAAQLGTALSQLRLRTHSESQLRSQQALQGKLIQLISNVKAVAQGNLRVHAEVATGEIGTVADFFNAIVDNLHQLVVQVRQITEQVTTVILEHDEAVQTLSQDSLLQAEEVTRTLTSLTQMTHSTHRVAAQAQQAAAIAKSASSKAENSGEAMDLTVQSILNLREITSETTHKVKRLGESSQQISKVVALIHDIAVQTNLLAINAGIEAHRAGAAGKGFFVVAEEVGELASRAATATQDIERLVSTIQEETFDVVEAMDRSTAEVVVGTRLVQDAKYDLSRILEVSQQIDRLLQSVSETTNSHASTSATVTQLMQDIIQLSECTSESSDQISESLHQTLATVQSLQATVSPFKVER